MRHKHTTHTFGYRTLNMVKMVIIPILLARYVKEDEEKEKEEEAIYNSEVTAHQKSLDDS